MGIVASSLALSKSRVVMGLWRGYNMHTCSGCSGHGVIECPICGGNGKIYRNTSSIGQLVCTKCKGLGNINCHSCKGNGNIHSFPKLLMLAKTTFSFSSHKN